MASENLATSDAGMARFQAYKRLARLLPRLPPELEFSVSSKFVLNLSHFLRDIVKKIDIGHIPGIFFKTPTIPVIIGFVEFSPFFFLRRIIRRTSNYVVQRSAGTEPCYINLGPVFSGDPSKITRSLTRAFSVGLSPVFRFYSPFS